MKNFERKEGDKNMRKKIACVKSSNFELMLQLSWKQRGNNKI